MSCPVPGDPVSVVPVVFNGRACRIFNGRACRIFNGRACLIFNGLYFPTNKFS
jgi:hypothetical protein